LQLQWLKELEHENQGLKRMCSDLSQEHQVLKDIGEKSCQGKWAETAGHRNNGRA